MKRIRMVKSYLSMALFAGMIVVGAVTEASAQTTAFTYTGQLAQSGTPANGSFNMIFTLFPAVTGGSAIGVPINRSVTVTNGTFSVPLDFGAGAFTGADRFLEVTVSGTPLTPRSQITSTPYAVRALTVSGPVTGASTVAALSVSNSQPGILNASPANLPPAALRGEATATNDSNVGVMGIADGAEGAGVIGVAPTGTGVLGLSTSGTGEGVSGRADGLQGVGVQAESSAGTAFRAKSTSGQLFVGNTSNVGDVFTVDTGGSVTLSGGITLTNGNFTLSSSGAMAVAGNRFTVDAGGNLIGQNISALLPGGGNSNMCVLGGSPILRVCSSSLRYKKDVGTFVGGMSIVKRLNPITFKWKENGMSDLGLGAEDVAKVAPLLTFNNDRGQVEGVKYSQINLVLINALKEQQQQIDNQRRMIDQGQAQVRALKGLICSNHQKARVCKSGK